MNIKDYSTGDLLSGYYVLSNNINKPKTITDSNSFLSITSVYTQGIIPTKLVGELNINGVKTIIYFDNTKSIINKIPENKNLTTKIGYLAISRDNINKIAEVLEYANIPIDNVISINIDSHINIFYKFLIN